MSNGSVDNALKRALAAGFTDWQSVRGLREDELEARLYQRSQPATVLGPRPEPDCAWIHRERKRPGVTLELLHEEYLAQHPNGLQYSAFCERYRVLLKRRGLSMRQHHMAGDKMFVDYSGKRASIIDPATGEVHAVELFVAVLGASNCTYVEVTRTQQVRDFVGSHVRAFAFFGGVPRSSGSGQPRPATTARLTQSLTVLDETRTLRPTSRRDRPRPSRSLRISRVLRMLSLPRASSLQSRRG